MLEIQVYEGKLPAALVRDFEFASIYRAEAIAVHDTVRDLAFPIVGGSLGYVRGASDDSEDPSLKRKALDDAIRKILSEAKKNPQVELISDVNIIHSTRGPVQIEGDVSPQDKYNPGYRGSVTLKVEAIGYKKRQV